MNARRLGALLSMLAVTLAAVPRIAVDDKPLEVAPISQNGRVLVPMRAIFASLGARLDYDGRTHTITATGAGHTVRLQIGNTGAIVDDRAIALDVPARIVGASTYVPLRFVAQSLGAVVGYDAASSLVTVSRAGAVARDGGAARRVGSMLPAPDATVATGYPTISAALAGDVPVGSAGLRVDGVDVTDATTFDGTAMTYIPQQGLPVGRHEVAFSGVDRDGVPFDATWSFTTSVAPAPDFGGAVPFRFYLENGLSFGYGDEMDLVLQAPPGGRAYVTTCASAERTWMYGNGPYYRASMRAPYGLDRGYCPIEAVYIGWNGRMWYAPLPIFARLRPRHPHERPTPRPTPDRWPPKPTPTPYPQPSSPPQPWSGQTPAPPIARPPHRPVSPVPLATAPPQSEQTAAPQPERTPRPQPTPRQPDPTAAPTEAPTQPPVATPPPPPQAPPVQPHAPPRPVQTPPD